MGYVRIYQWPVSIICVYVVVSVWYRERDLLKIRPASQFTLRVLLALSARLVIRWNVAMLWGWGIRNQAFNFEPPFTFPYITARSMISRGNSQAHSTKASSSRWSGATNPWQLQAEERAGRLGLFPPSAGPTLPFPPLLRAIQAYKGKKCLFYYFGCCRRSARLAILTSSLSVVLLNANDGTKNQNQVLASFRLADNGSPQ